MLLHVIKITKWGKLVNNFRIFSQFPYTGRSKLQIEDARVKSICTFGNVVLIGCEDGTIQKIYLDHKNSLGWYPAKIDKNFYVNGIIIRKLMAV